MGITTERIVMMNNPARKKVTTIHACFDNRRREIRLPYECTSKFGWLPLMRGKQITCLMVMRSRNEILIYHSVNSGLIRT